MYNFEIKGFKDDKLVVWGRTKGLQQAKQIKAAPYCDRIEINALNDRARKQIELKQGRTKQ